MRWAVLTSVCLGCRHKDPQLTPIAPDQPSVRVVSVSPATIEPGKPRAVTVYGSGFVDGATVRVGEAEADSVQVKSDNQLVASLPALEVGTWDLSVENPDRSEDQLRAALVVQGDRGPLGCEYVVLYFETDQSQLLPAAQTTLTSLVPCYARTDDPVRIAGHADERGTTDYNLSLSLARALTVQAWLIHAGMPKDRLPVTSYGEEHPAVEGWGEAAWAQNRRVELTVD